MGGSSGTMLKKRMVGPILNDIIIVLFVLFVLPTKFMK